MLSGLVQYGWRIAHSARVHPDPAETAWGRDNSGGGSRACGPPWSTSAVRLEEPPSV